MNTILRELKKNWIRVWLSIAILLAVGIFGTYAVYSEIASVKRVVSVETSAKVFFSSNRMRVVTYMRRLDTDYDDITVCNYDQNKPNEFNPLTVRYTLTAKVLRRNTEGTYVELAANEYSDLSEEYSITMISDDSETIGEGQRQKHIFKTGGVFTLANQTLTPSRNSTDIYRVTIDPSDKDADNAPYIILLEANPSAGATDRISAQIYGQKNINSGSVWTGKLIEPITGQTEYDFYNYAIFGSGKGTVDIYWDPTKVEINEFFFEGVSGNEFVANSRETGVTYDGKNGLNKITLKVDSTEKSRYELQLYKKQGFNRSSAGENAVNYIFIKFEKGAE